MSQQGSPPDFSAADSALGYLYQARLALLLALRRLARDQTLEYLVEYLGQTTVSGNTWDRPRFRRNRGGTLDEITVSAAQALPENRYGVDVGLCERSEEQGLAGHSAILARP